MSNKTLFEKLFEEVMQDDAQALGLPSPEEGGSEGAGEGMGEEGGMEDEGQVTVTMDRETAQKLHDLLASVLGAEETPEEDFGGEGEAEGEEDGESWGSEDAEEDESEDEDAEEEDDEASAELAESPQSEYVPFETEGKAKTLQGKGNMTVKGAVASKVSGQGNAEKTAQTQGTAHYMPFKPTVKDGKGGGAVVDSKMKKQSGAGDSLFQA